MLVFFFFFCLNGLLTECVCVQVHNTHIGTAKSTKKLGAATPESGR